MPKKRTKYWFTTIVEGERKRRNAKPDAARAMLRGVGSLMDLTGRRRRTLAATGDSGKYVVSSTKGGRVFAKRIFFDSRESRSRRVSRRVARVHYLLMKQMRRAVGGVGKGAYKDSLTICINIHC